MCPEINSWINRCLGVSFILESKQNKGNALHFCLRGERWGEGQAGHKWATLLPQSHMLRGCSHGVQYSDQSVNRDYLFSPFCV